jgi:hypothetical protein
VRKKVGLLYFVLLGFSFVLYLLTYIDSSTGRFFNLVALPLIFFVPGGLVMNLQLRSFKYRVIGYWKEFFAPMPPGMPALYFGIIALWFIVLLVTAMGMRGQSRAKELNGSYVLYSETSDTRIFVSPDEAQGEPEITLDSVPVKQTFGGTLEMYTEISRDEYHRLRLPELRMATLMEMSFLWTCALFYWFPREKKKKHEPSEFFETQPTTNENDYL